jgi:AraC-like DNA-binding protein
MGHGFLATADLDLVLSPARWRLAAPETTAAVRPSAAETAWRRRNRHAHPHAEAMLVLAGTGGFAVGDRVHDARPGLFALLPPGVPHDCGMPPGGRARQLWLAWIGGRILVSLVEGDGGWTSRTVLVLGAGAVAFDPDLLRDDPAPRADPWRMRTALAAVLAQVAEAGWRRPGAPALQDDALAALIHHLDATGGGGHSLTSLARLAGTGRTWFARAFRAATGCTVGGYIDRCRAARARALRAEGASETVIASELGFSCVQSWARWRRQHAG